MLSLPELGPVTLDALLTEYCREKYLPDYTCDNCLTKGRTTEEEVFGENGWPSVLVINLKRFHGVSKKITIQVTFKETWSPGPNLTYSLRAVLVHHGGAQNAGHYTAYVRDSAAIWYHCDDRLEPRVLGTSEEALRAEAYMLFYVRLDGPQL